MLPSNAAGGHEAGFRGIRETSGRSFEVGEEPFGRQRNRCGLGSVLVLEEGLVGELGELIVVIRVPNTLGGLQVDARVSTVFGHAG